MKKRSPLFIIFMTIFIDLVGFGIVLPLSPFYAQHFGASAEAVGMLQSSYSVMQFLFAPIWGRLSDRVGRRPIILMSLFGSFVSYFIFAQADALWVLFAARMLQGAFGANISATQAYVADITTGEDRSKGMGIVGAAFGLGFIFGPAIGAYLSRNESGAFGMGFPALVASFVCLANFILAYFNLPESLKPENRASRDKVYEKRFSLITRSLTGHVGWLLFVIFLSAYAMACMESTLALFTESRLSYGIRQTGELFAFVGLVIAFTQGYLIRKLFPKFGERKLLVVGPLIAALGFIAIAGVHNTLSMMATMVFVAVGTGFANPAMMGALSLLTDSTEQGAIMGVSQSLSSLARILGPVSGGLLFGQIGTSAPYWLSGAATLLALGLILRNIKVVPDARKLHAH